MNARPIFFKNQNDFIDFLNSNKNVYDDKIIDRFIKLPEKIVDDDGSYQLEVILTPLPYTTSTRYEINYFNENDLNYLFPYINDEDIEISLDILEKNLKSSSLV